MNERKVNEMREGYIRQGARKDLDKWLCQVLAIRYGYADGEAMDKIQLQFEEIWELAKKEGKRELMEWLKKTSWDAHTVIFQVSEKDWKALEAELE